MNANGEHRKAIAIAFASAFAGAVGAELARLAIERVKALLSRRNDPPETPPGPT